MSTAITPPPQRTAADRPPPRHPRPDLVEGPIRSHIFRLAMPVLAEQVLLAMVAWCDIYFAGTLSPAATAAVGFGAYVGWLASMLMGLVATGATALVARHVGAADRDTANLFANQAIAVAACLGIVSSTLFWCIAPLFSVMQGLHPDTARLTTIYLRIDACTYVLSSIGLAASASLRGAGDMRTPLYVMGTVNVVNVAMTALLTHGAGPIPGLGVVGIALGTAIGRVVGAAFILTVLVRGRSGLRLVPGALRPRRSPVHRLLRIGIPAAADSAVLWSGHFVFLLIIAASSAGALQTATLAAHYIAIRVESLSYLPAMAWALSAATMVGQALGAGKPARASRCGYEAAAQCAILLTVIGAVYLLCADLFFSLMTSDPLVRDIGAPVLRLIAFAQPGVAALIVLQGALRGAGDTRFPMLITIVGMMLLRLPLAYAGMHLLGWGLLGAWLGMFADLNIRGLLATWRFATGHWKRIRV